MQIGSGALGALLAAPKAQHELVQGGIGRLAGFSLHLGDFVSYGLGPRLAHVVEHDFHRHGGIQVNLGRRLMCGDRALHVQRSFRRSDSEAGFLSVPLFFLRPAPGRAPPHPS